MLRVGGSSPPEGTMALYPNRQREPAQTRYSLSSSLRGATKQELTSPVGPVTLSPEIDGLPRYGEESPRSQLQR
jgi:hypothetical protein